MPIQAVFSMIRLIVGLAHGYSKGYIQFDWFISHLKFNRILMPLISGFQAGWVNGGWIFSIPLDFSYFYSIFKRGCLSQITAKVYSALDIHSHWPTIIAKVAIIFSFSAILFYRLFTGFALVNLRMNFPAIKASLSFFTRPTQVALNSFWLFSKTLDDLTSNFYFILRSKHFPLNTISFEHPKFSDV